MRPYERWVRQERAIRRKELLITYGGAVGFAVFQTAVCLLVGHWLRDLPWYVFMPLLILLVAVPFHFLRKKVIQVLRDRLQALRDISGIRVIRRDE
jgi:hypothetical protein